MNDLDPKEHYSSIFLFLRADERVQSVEADQKTVEIQFQDHKNEVAEKFREQNEMIKSLMARMDNQVSKTGLKNSEDIGELKTEIALFKRDLGEFRKQLFDADTGFIQQVENMRDWQGTFNKSMMTFFIIGVFGALILWAFKNF